MAGGGGYKACVPWTLIIAWYALASAVTAGAFWIDKRRAAAGRWRITERTLHGLELAGGWPGAIVAMALIRHKNRKASYWLVTALVGAVHAAAWGWFALRP